ncbi:protein glass [Drosophila miranda]|uniref:protein glass n=1 Tax=Drosophila miranda TaxID=7229 RepID=UPI0007E60EA8|nr:protein glass [Drosophila miranda]XP_033243161.1 protein glass [Drosophila miranda]
MAAENYHLKWDSHLSYLNTSIATLYKNEKFADVVLYSSYTSSSINSDIPTVGISAHKFILSSCSQFFATMFETAPIASPNGVIYVVLPPDLSHRAIQILVQYMYSGEATVSNDILNEVLRGGEILKIRGLCRSSASNNSSTTVTSSHHHPHGGHLHQRDSSASAMYVSNGSRSTLPPPPPPPMSTQLPGDIYSSKPSSSSNSGSGRYTLEHHHHQPQPQHHPPSHQHQHQQQQQQQNQHNHHHHHQQQFRGLGASVMPKDSPVIVKSPKMAAHTGLLSVASSSKLGISVNKEVAIDPEDKCCYAAATSQVEPQPPPSSTTAGAVAVTVAVAGGVPPPPAMSICTEVGCSSCPLAVGTASEPTDTTLRRPEYEEQALCEREDVGLVYERRLRRESACDRAHEYYEAPLHFATPPPPPPPQPHSFLSIKQEPSDWTNNPPTTANASNNNHEDGHLSPKQPLDFKMSAVKLEVNRDRATPHEESEEHTLRDYNNFKQLLVCEICQKSFEDTKTLVRHLGTHANEPGSGTNLMAASASGSASTTSSNTNLAMRALKTYVPKKRRRVSQQENNMDHDHVTLLCDLCSTSFETPAEWVRHMNSQHTEIELAMFNSKKDGEQKGQHQQQQLQVTTNNTTSGTTNSISSSIGGSSSSTVSTSQMQPKFHSSSTRSTLLQCPQSQSQTQSQSLILNKRNNFVAAATPASVSPTGLSVAATSSHG